MFAHTYAGIQKRRGNEVMRAPNSHSQSQMNDRLNSPGTETMTQISRNQTKLSDFCKNEEK